MEFAASTASTVIGDYLVKPTVNQVRYLFCFKNIVQELDRAEDQLQTVKRDVENDVKRAQDNTENIKKEVQVWLDRTSNILKKVQTLKRKIEVNKTCLNGWCPNLFCRYWLGRKAAKKTSIMLQFINGEKFETVGYRATLPGIKFLAPKDFEHFETSMSAFDGIVKALKDDNTHMVILYGMGGTGKTTLAKAVSNNVKEMGIFNEVLMAVVSQTPNFRIIQERLADSLNMKFEENTEEGRAQRLFVRFSHFKNPENKIPVILDDIWEEFDFQDKLGIQLSKYCKILLTTRYKDVCIVREGLSLIPLKVMKENEGVTLLRKQAGIGDDSETLNALVRKVARECGFLPLALVAIGRYLRGKDIERWELVCEKLKKSKLEDIRNVKTSEISVYASLKLSYDYLISEKIKLSFLLCSLFPEDCEIPLEGLARYGMGLDLYEDVGSIESSRKELRSMVRDLKNLGLLLDVGEEEFVKMHDLVRDVALWIASAGNNEGKNVFMSETGMNSRDWSNAKGRKPHTAISSTANEIAELPSGLVCPELKILLLSGKDYFNQLKVSDEYFEEMKGVKVMSLSYIQNLSLKSIQFLSKLKTLELIDCHSFRDISSLGKLNELEILS